MPGEEASRGAETTVRYGRLGALALLIVGLLVIGRATGLTSYLSTARVRELMDSAGVWGPFLFLAAFSIGELVHVPGMVFVAASVVAYGRVAGGALALVGAVVSLTVSFVVVRAVGGKPLGAIRWRFAQKLLARLDDRPVRTVALVGSSRVDLQACKLEYSIVSPK